MKFAPLLNLSLELKLERKWDADFRGFVEYIY